MRGKPEHTVGRHLIMTAGHTGNDGHQTSRTSGDDRQQPGRPGQVSPARWRRSGRVLLVIVAACLCAVVAGVSLAVFTPPSSHPGGIAGASNNRVATTAPAAHPTAPAASSRSTAGPVGTSDGIAKTALRPPPGLKPQILAWKAAPSGVALSVVTVNLGKAMQDAGIKLHVQMNRVQGSRLEHPDRPGRPAHPGSGYAAAVRQVPGRAFWRGSRLPERDIDTSRRRSYGHPGEHGPAEPVASRARRRVHGPLHGHCGDPCALR